MGLSVLLAPLPFGLYLLVYLFIDGGTGEMIRDHPDIFSMLQMKGHVLNSTAATLTTVSALLLLLERNSINTPGDTEDSPVPELSFLPAAYRS